jgi:polyisoprenoid-binding protein YceI
MLERMKLSGLFVAAGGLVFLTAGLTPADPGGSGGGAPAAGGRSADTSRARYKIDPAKSRFTVETQTSGLSSMFGHDHRIGASGLAGSVSFIPGAPESASVDLTVEADSLRLLDDGVSDANRVDIERMIQKSLETTKWKQIRFHSSGVEVETIGDAIFQIALGGELRLHGVGHPVTLPAQVIVRPDVLRVSGVYKLRQTDYKITPFSLAGGTVKVRDEVTLTFDLVAPRS